jgi:hypothetical protein
MNHGPPPLKHLFEALADLVADKLAERLAARALDAAPFYDADTAPVKRRQFLEAARRGDFPSFKRGKRVLARREDVDRWIESGARARPDPAPARDEASDEDLLARSGLLLLTASRKGPR